MADYGAQQGRVYRPNNYGHASNFQRDAAFSDIFGSAPPPGRSQTMTPQPPQPNQGRAQTMSSQPSEQQPVQRGPPPVRHMQNGYGPPATNGYNPNINPSNSRPPNGYPSSQPPPQNLPQPLFPERRPYPQPQRLDPRLPPGQQQYANKTMTSRVAPPALNSDAYRSRSMARMGGAPGAYPPQANSFNHTSASAFRQQPYNSNLPPRTTPSGRPIPDRDDRAMSMSAYTPDKERSQTMSGRIIPTPHRRRESQNSNDLQLDQRSPEKSFASLPQNPKARRPSEGSIPSRSMSMASGVVSPPAQRADSLQHRPSVTKPDSQSASTIITTQRRAPLVYPALLSRVADTFKDRVGVGDRSKNELSYKNAFTGAEAVDIIAYIIKTTDRNLALLLGRALDAQKFFHDVTYDHRLRDSVGEIYQFKETINQGEALSEVNGVFTLLTECYSPTCTRDNLCYSIACPRRLEQQARLNMKPQPILKNSTSRASLHADDTDSHQLWINSVSKEVADTVGDREKKRQEVISEIAYTERDFVKDVEYLRDFWMIPLRSTNPANPSPIPEHRREKFIRTVFSNISDVLAVNQKFSEMLTARQRENPVVRNVGDIFLQFVPKFDPFIKYGASQLYGKHEFEKEKASNPTFSKFVDETERLKESRKLELNGYLTKPTTRLARYPLLLENVLKYSADDNPDKKDIPVAIGLIRDFLTKVNIETGKAENHFTLTQLYQALKFPPGEFVDLKLNEENRQLIFKGTLKKSPTDNAEVQAYLFDHAVLLVRVKTINKKEETKVYRKPIPLELLVILQMDEVIPKLGIAKRTSSSLIPTTKPASATPTAKEGFPITFKHIGKGGYDITLYAHSQVSRRKWMEHIEAQQRKIRERSNFFSKTNICDNFFTSANKVNCLVPIGKQRPGLSVLPERVLITAADGGRKLVIGTDLGIYVTDRWPKDKSIKPKRVIEASQVTQIDVLEEYQLLLVLSNKTLTSYAMEALEPNDSQNPLVKRPKKIQGHVNFFKSGIGLGRHLVASVKTSALSTTIKVFEPMDNLGRQGRRPAISRMFQSGQDALKPFKVSIPERFAAALSRLSTISTKKSASPLRASHSQPELLGLRRLLLPPFTPESSSVSLHTPAKSGEDELTIKIKEFYIPAESSSVHFLRSTLCVGCSRGFEVVSLETTETQSLLDQADTSLDFVQRKENIRPIHIERLNGEFLLNYSDFSFFVNRNGWRARPDWRITWEGSPTDFALSYPYILAFEQNFLEIRHVETAELIHIMTGKNIRMLHASTREVGGNRHVLFVVVFPS
jgi:RHO1 GDP-GTP exchange protein 1/2